MSLAQAKKTVEEPVKRFLDKSVPVKCHKSTYVTVLAFWILIKQELSWFI